MKLPNFSLPADDGNTYTEKDFHKGVSIIFLYPKDNTPGCTLESQNFRDNKENFDKLGVKIFGLSKDSIKSHDKFRCNHDLNYPLLSDEETSFIDAMGAWKEKSMYGKTFMGVVRSTYVIQDGEVIKEWSKVKVKGHIEEVLEYCKNL